MGCKLFLIGDNLGGGGALLASTVIQEICLDSEISEACGWVNDKVSVPPGSVFKPVFLSSIGRYLPRWIQRAILTRRLNEEWIVLNLTNFPIIEKKKLSKAAIETLTIIAYYQPITRPEIEKIRGVSISKGTLDILLEEGWISLGKRKITPGRPGTFITTEGFLDHFGLISIKDLPGIEELKQAGFGKIELPIME